MKIDYLYINIKQKLSDRQYYLREWLYNTGYILLLIGGIYMNIKVKQKGQTGLIRISSLSVIITVLIISTGAASWPTPDEDMLNSTPPEYYDIVGAHQLTDSGEELMGPNILIDSGDNMHIIWSDMRNDPDKTDLDFLYDLYYMKLDKAGNVVIDEIRLWDMTGIPLHLEPNKGAPRHFGPHPAVALDSNEDVHIAFQDYTKHTYNHGTRIDSEVYYIKLAGDAESVSDLIINSGQRVSQGLATSGSVDIGIDSGDNVHIAWYDHRSAYYNWEIYYEKLDNDGNVLIDDKRLTYQSYYQGAPEIGIDSEDNLHIVYKQYNQFDHVYYVKYLKLDSDGDELVSPKTVATDGKYSPSPYEEGYPLIVVDSEDTLHLSWQDDRYDDNMEIYYLGLDNDGDALMTEPLRITDNSGLSSIQGMGPVQSMAIDDSDNIYLLWRDDTTGSEQIYIAVINPDGTVFYEPYRITETASFSESPSIAFDSWSNIHIAWYDNVTGASEIYHAVLSPPAFSFAFEATGVKSSTVEVQVFVNDELVDKLEVKSHEGLFVSSKVIQYRDSDTYSLEFWLKPGSGNKNSQGAVPVIIYMVRDGEPNVELDDITMNSNSGKNAKSSVTEDLTDNVGLYF